MNANVKLWCFLLLLPFFLAVGHDLYANYGASEEKKMRLESFQIDPKSYQSSDLGYIFLKYTPDQYRFVREITGEDQWNKWAEPVLRQYTFVVALAPALVFFIWLLIARIFDFWPFESFSAPRRGEMSSPGKGEGGMEFKYKRR